MVNLAQERTFGLIFWASSNLFMETQQPQQHQQAIPLWVAWSITLLPLEVSWTLLELQLEPLSI